MAIKIRRGKYSDYDPSKLVSGELAVVLEGDPNSKTGRSLYVCFQPGTVKRIVDYDDLVDLLANASDTYVEKISDEYLSNINTATDSANKAASSATAASESATSAAGNANKAASEASTQAERAETALAGLGSAITSDKVKNNLTTMDAGYVLDARQGKVLNDKFGSYVPTANIVDNLTTASSSKVLSANQGKALADRMTTVETDINSPTAVTDPADKTVLLSGGSGIDYAKLADAIIARYNANGLINNVTTSTAAQGALDAAQGKALYDLISANKTDISSLNSGLAQLYPVGSIYLSVNDTNPSTFIGGTWERIKDRFLLAAGDKYVAGSTGGEAQHTLTKAELPNGIVINRNPTKKITITGLKRNSISIGTDEWAFGANVDFSTAEGITLYGEPHNNMPPYIAVYMWVRTA